jgi:hypothetical protein
MASVKLRIVLSFFQVCRCRFRMELAPPEAGLWACCVSKTVEVVVGGSSVCFSLQVFIIVMTEYDIRFSEAVDSVKGFFNFVNVLAVVEPSCKVPTPNWCHCCAAALVRAASSRTV